jgi:elongation factor 2
MIKRAFHESQLRAKPRLLEPVFVVEIQAPESAMDIIIGLLNQYSSNILQRFEREGTQLITTRSYLHGGFLVGFAEAFRAATSGQVTPQCVFSHWGTMSSDPLKASSLTGQMVLDIRKAKKMKELSVALKELEL